MRITFEDGRIRFNTGVVRFLRRMAAKVVPPPPEVYGPIPPPVYYGPMPPPPGKPSRYFAEKERTLRSYIDFYLGRSIPDFPMEVYIELSNHCNLRCAMCGTFSALNPDRAERLKAVPRQFVDFDAMIDQLDSVLTRAIIVHCYGFGEATLHPQFPEIIARLAQYEVMLDFITNGSRLTDSLVETLVENRVFEVMVSLSGTTAEEYENVYLGGRFDQVLAGIRRLAECKKRHDTLWPVVNISSIAFEHNVQNLEALVELAADHGANSIVLRPLDVNPKMPQLAAHAAIYQPAVHDPILARAHAAAARRGVRFLPENWLERRADSPEQARQMKLRPLGRPESEHGELLQIGLPVSQIKRVALEMRTDCPAEPPPEALPTGWKLSVDVRRDSPADAIAKLRPHPQKLDATCPYPFTGMYIDAMGRTKPCCYANIGSGLGDVGPATAEEVWQGPGYQAMRSLVLAGHYPTMCDACLAVNFMPKVMSHPFFADRFAPWFNSYYSPHFDPRWLKQLWPRSPHLTERAIATIRRHRPDLADLLGTANSLSPSARMALLEAGLGHESQIPTELSILCEGWFDGIFGDRLTGWAYSPFLPDLRLTIRIAFDGRVVHEILADQFRPDLLAAGKTDGSCGFGVPLAALPNVKGIREIAAWVGSTRCHLPQSPLRFDYAQPGLAP